MAGHCLSRQKATNKITNISAEERKLYDDTIVVEYMWAGHIENWMPAKHENIDIYFCRSRECLVADKTTYKQMSWSSLVDSVRYHAATTFFRIINWMSIWWRDDFINWIRIPAVRNGLNYTLLLCQVQSFMSNLSLVQNVCLVFVPFIPSNLNG